MLGDRKYNDQIVFPSNASSSRLTPQHTPRPKQRPNPPLPRKSITPSRIQDRLNSSPLRGPLENVIDKCTKERSIDKNGRSRVLGRSSRREGDSSSSVLRRGLFEEEEGRGHSETVEFLKSYFDLESPIPLGSFMERIIQRYSTLWENQDIEQILEHLTYKIAEYFDGESVDPRELLRCTRENGMIGFILEIFHLINEGKPACNPSRSSRNQSYVCISRSPNMQSINRSFEEQINDCASTQNLKNIVQEFMETMYAECEKEIYGRFQVEMRRMVLKYRETEKIMKNVHEKLTNHADYFEAERMWKARCKNLEEERQDARKRADRLDEELRREKDLSQELRNAKARLEDENAKLKEYNDKLQNVMINKFESLPSEASQPSTLPTLSRRITNTPLNDRTPDYNNQSSSFIKEPQPFQIKIDTHFIQRDLGPPIAQTSATFMDQNYNPAPISFPINPPPQSTYSPIKLGEGFESSRPSMESGIRKIGEFTSYSPYQSRITRPF